MSNRYFIQGQIQKSDNKSGSTFYSFPLLRHVQGLSTFFLDGRFTDFSEKKIPSKSLSKWSYKYNQLLFRIFR
jgi:hypothetical protein